MQFDINLILVNLYNISFQYYKIIVNGMIEVPISDIDFYERKIQSIEQDNHYLHEEIMKLRARLRVAQDFQIRYNLLVASNQRDTERLRIMIEKHQEEKWQQILASKTQENESKWQSRINELEFKLKKDASSEIQSLKTQLQSRNSLYQDMKAKVQEVELFNFKMNKIEKQNENLKEQIDQMRQYYEKQRTEETTKLRQTLTTTYREKIESQRKKYDARVSDLEKRLHELELKEDNVTFKASEATNRELGSLKISFQQKSNLLSREMAQLKASLTQKNEQINKILAQKAENDEKHRENLRQKYKYIRSLEDKIVQREKQHEIQLLNLVQRSKAARQEQIEELLKQINRLNADISRSSELWDEKIRNHQQEIEQLNLKFEDERRKLVDEKNLHKRKFSELSIKMREADGDRQLGETEMLIKSLRDMDMKEENIDSYQNGITFLQRQYKKLHIKLEEKSMLISKLYKQIKDIREGHDKQLSEVKEKLKKQKKDSTERILAIQTELRDTIDKLKQRQREERKRQREIFKEKDDLEEKNRALKDLNDELVRDYNRVIQDKKSVQASYREERQKSFTSKSDLNLVKKQKWLQLQKQKNELQIIFKQKQEQIKLDKEQKVDDLTGYVNRLKQQLELVSKDNEILKKQNQKLLGELQRDKENCRLSQYNKKMASLNLEIALTQNLYESLAKARSRVSISPAGSQVQMSLNDMNQENEEPLLMSFHPSANILK